MLRGKEKVLEALLAHAHVLSRGPFRKSLNEDPVHPRGILTTLIPNALCPMLQSKTGVLCPALKVPHPLLFGFLWCGVELAARKIAWIVNVTHAVRTWGCCSPASGRPFAAGS